MTAIRKMCSWFNFSSTSNITILILLWLFSNSLVYYMCLEPLYIAKNLDVKITTIATSGEAILCALSPLAGLLADVKYGRYKVLKMSTHFMIAFESLTLIFWILLSTTVDTIDFTYYIMVTLFVTALIGYYLGKVFFFTNIIQFGTDQLRDMPTASSDKYIQLILFMEHLAKLFVNACKGIATDRILLDSYYKTIHISTTNAVVFEVIFSSTLILTIVVVFMVEKYSTIFMVKIIKGNPYKLVFGVIKFAIKHKKPLRRSAFTYCEDERPSRIDFGKQRYGGPFTTEQVENVKAFINMTKILILMSPFFLLDLNSKIFLYKDGTYHKELSNNTVTRLFLGNGVLSPLISTLSIPFFMLLIKPYFSKYIPSMFKRMGLSLLIQSMLFLLYIICGTTSRYDHSYVLRDNCLGYYNNSHIHQWRFLKIPKVFMPFTQQVLSSLSQMLCYIAVWQFISCQSPQYMKGLLFGFYFFIKAVTELLASIMLYSYLNSWRLFLGCEFDVYFLNLVIGLSTLTVFIIVARKYKYRKRDDICNVYQYAEDYYSHHH